MLSHNLLFVLCNICLLDYCQSWNNRRSLDFSGENVVKDDEEWHWIQLSENVDYHVIGMDDTNPRKKSDSSTERGPTSPMSSRKKTKKKQKDMHESNEHPMRTDEWIVDVTLSPLLFPPTVQREAMLFPVFSNGTTLENYERLDKSWKGKRRKRQFFKFARNGCVLLTENNDESLSNRQSWEDSSLSPSKKLEIQPKPYQRRTNIGRWQIDTHGISWTIPIRISGKETILHYHADIHLNKFQKRPHMFRGIVVRDRFSNVNTMIPKQVLRPVIATFTAEGVGEDTVDVSYKSRGFGFAHR